MKGYDVGEIAATVFVFTLMLVAIFGFAALFGGSR